MLRKIVIGFLCLNLCFCCLLLVYGERGEFMPEKSRNNTEMPDKKTKTHSTAAQGNNAKKTAEKASSTVLAKPEAKKVHYTEDRTYSRKYDKSGDRSVRFGAQTTNPGFHPRWLEWKGGKRISIKKLAEIVRIVFKRMPHVRTTDEAVALLVETAIAESSGGFYISPRGGDHGVFQIRTKVAEETLAWIKSEHPDIYAAVMLFRSPKKTLEQDLDANIPFGAAMAITEYWRKAGPDWHGEIQDLRSRAIMWKSVYNSRKGAGTVADYEKRTADYGKLCETVRIDQSGILDLPKSVARPKPGKIIVSADNA